MGQSYEYEAFWTPVISSYIKGKTALPSFMGLEEQVYSQLVRQYVSQKTRGISSSPDGLADDKALHFSEKRLTINSLNESRSDEIESLTGLLSCHADYAHLYTKEAIQVIACGCMGFSHLWSDLGLPERARLGQMIQCYFPELHAANDKNMRWKRFFYRQLCQEEGDYVCRAPSCEECSSSDECFS